MAAKAYCLDSDVVIWHLRNTKRRSTVTAFLESLARSGRLVCSTLTVAEVLQGTRPDEEARTRNFLGALEDRAVQSNGIAARAGPRSPCSAMPRDRGRLGPARPGPGHPPPPRPPRAFRFLRDDEAGALVAAAERGPWRTMILAALKTGLRYSELAGLRWEDIDLAGRVLLVRRGKVLGRIDSPKNGRTRHVPITSDVAAALAALPRTTGVVFDQVDTYRQASRAIERFSKAAGLVPVGWHTLRHTFASKLVAAGVPIRAVQDLLGHASIQMTMRYAHLGPQELRAAMNVLEPEKMGNTWATPTRDVAPPIEGTVANGPQESQNHRVETVV